MSTEFEIKRPPWSTAKTKQCEIFQKCVVHPPCPIRNYFECVVIVSDVLKCIFPIFAQSPRIHVVHRIVAAEDVKVQTSFQ